MKRGREGISVPFEVSQDILEQDTNLELDVSIFRP